MSNRFSLTRDQFTTLVNSHRDAFTTNHPDSQVGYGFDADDDNPWHTFSLYFTSMRPKMLKWAKETCGLEITDDSITVDLNNSIVLDHLCDLIIAEYDTPATNTVCKAFGVGGDNDVDYCGSNPQIGLEILNVLQSLKA